MNSLLLQEQNEYFLKRFIRIAFWIIPLVFGFVSLYLGKDLNWDLKNYHYYNAYAFLENRLNFDIAPAQVQTYINPISDLPFYWLTQNFHSSVAGFVLGWVHGFNLSFIFLIFLRITKPLNSTNKFTFGLMLSFFSSIAPGFVSELGNTMHDNLTSIFVLGSLYLLIASLNTSNNYRQIILAGFILGLGVGLKPSIAIFAMSTAIVLVFFQVDVKHKIKSLTIYGLSGILGGLITAGFWWWELWKRFKNPFFPFYNHIFKSPYFTNLSVEWSRFIPESLTEFLMWPFIFTLNSLRVNQYEFFDIRFAVIYIIVFTWIIYSLGKLVFVFREIEKDQMWFDLQSSNFLLLFFFVSYLLWINESSTYRFLIPLELLSPLCFLIILDRVISDKKTKSLIIIISAVIVLFTFRPFSWGRTDWTKSYFELDTTLLVDTDEPIVIMLGDAPTSYVIPLFPSQYRFIRPDGNIRLNKPKEIKFISDIKIILKNHKGNLYILYNKNEKDIPVEEILKSLDIIYLVEKCYLLKINIPDQIEFCQLNKDT